MLALAMNKQHHVSLQPVKKANRTALDPAG